MQHFIKKVMVAIIFLGAIGTTQVVEAAIVDTNSTYTYESMKKDLQELDEAYGDLIELYTIGQSAYGRDLILVRLGNGDADTFYNGSHHAREWLTTILNMKMIEEYGNAAYTNSRMSGYNVKDLLEETTLWFIPMVNPDGVTLQQKGLNAFPKEIHSSLISMNNGSSNFDRWKANAQGIDLNRQYPSGWAEVKATSPSWKNYKGKYPFQAPEAKVMRDITYLLEPDLSLAYHTSGRILYWNFNVEQVDLARDRSIAETYAYLSGYRMVPTYSGAGYTDWINEVFNRPSLTPELALFAGEKHVNPVTFPETWRRNKGAGLAMAEESIALSSGESVGEQPVVWGDKALEAAIRPPGKGDDLYKKALRVKEDFELTQEQTVELYSWYQQCETCSIKDRELEEVFDSLNHFEEIPEKKSVNTDKSWTITLNTKIDPDSVNRDNVYIQGEYGSTVSVDSVEVAGEKITISPLPGSYERGQTYTMYIKDLASIYGKKMEKPVEMTFTIQ
ncbi:MULTISPECIES: M14 family zinc carboxypeptidase [Pontibacillus]|uniref:M14 family zinc carboxypeptidase n=1 Tax=Pontibacillus chungwhensis TaxID=265426 RepID=A0ABY8V2A3_9BACI|nr:MULTISPECIES: M14 family zinc carboxypeptidase [Pontibacillus]MCD5324316.1 Ig-like domain-containing protein [Pontibacillus sp. HN14]WIF99387.1 M14 family zinc carboxypeptidase [Pontibacillus chungwhensis]